MSVQSDLVLILDELSAEFVERRQMLEANALALLSKQHSFNLGLPGTGKSLIICSLMDRFPGARQFEALLSKTRPDAAILGPYNLPELREHGNFHRKINGFLPTANLAFLDEIGKMGMTLGHDLLGILNERKYHEVNGDRTFQQVPLYTAFTASNEMITEDSDDAAALWDRLLIRVHVEPIKDRANLVLLLDGSLHAPATPTTIRWEDMTDVIDNVVPSIVIPRNVIEGAIELENQLKQHELAPSNRRLRQSMRVLQASAYLNGRSQVEEDDLYVLRYTMWDRPDQISTVERICLSISNPLAEQVLGILDKVEEIAAGISQRKGTALEHRAQYGAEATAKLKGAEAELHKLRQDSITAGRSVTKLDEAGERMAAVKRAVYIDCLDMDPSVLDRKA